VPTNRGFGKLGINVDGVGTTALSGVRLDRPRVTGRATAAGERRSHPEIARRWPRQDP
jgi:hypothetical protein